MAKLILKSPYIKSKGGAGGYLRYIGTREHVEIVPDDRPPTRKQEQLITRLVRDFPDTKELIEYEDYAAHPTKARASALISLALEINWEAVQQTNVYAKYIATRPRVERLGSHGLFGDEDHVDLAAAMDELEHYTGNVWTHIISLKREDAERLGYDSADAWRNLLRAHRNDVAAAMHIPPQDFRWYAAFHDEGHHPHVHMMAWSAKPGQAYLSRDGIQQIRSQMVNDIFKQEMLHTYEQRSASRDELVREARRALLELTREMRQGICDHPDAEQMMQELSVELGMVKGKKSYSYLPKRLKQQVDEIVDQMERLPVASECYDKWLNLQRQVDSYYKDEQRQRKKLSEEKEFRAIKNAVIREAEHIRLGTVTFEDGGISQKDEREDFIHASDEYWRLYRVILDRDYTIEERESAVIGMEQLAESGDADAQYAMGKLCRDGPIPIPDWVNAVHWFDKAARQGMAEAQYALGKLLLSNDPEIHDPETGLRWLEIAAQSDNGYAAYRLGKEYLRGEIVAKDTQKAVEYFQSAAEGGNQYAQYMLGKLSLTEGRREQGLYWMQLSADQGNAYARHFLDRQDTLNPPSVMLSVTRLLHHIGRIIQDDAPLPPVSGGVQIDQKRLQELIDQKGYQTAMSYAREQEQQGYGGMAAPW